MSRLGAEDEAGRPLAAPATLFLIAADAEPLDAVLAAAERHAASTDSPGDAPPRLVVRVPPPLLQRPALSLPLGDAYLWLSPFCTNFHAPPAEAWPLSWWQGPFREGVKTIGKARRALTESSGGGRRDERGVGARNRLPSSSSRGRSRAHSRTDGASGSCTPPSPPRCEIWGDMERDVSTPPSPPRCVPPPVRPFDQRTPATRPRHVRDMSETRPRHVRDTSLLRCRSRWSAPRRRRRGCARRRDSPRFAEIRRDSARERERREREESRGCPRRGGRVRVPGASLTRPHSSQALLGRMDEVVSAWDRKAEGGWRKAEALPRHFLDTS